MLLEAGEEIGVCPLRLVGESAQIVIDTLLSHDLENFNTMRGRKVQAHLH